MRCIRCGQEFNQPNANVCGNCADDLRQEEEAQVTNLDTGLGYSDRCQFCKEFGAKVEPYLCEHCRDKILRWFNSKSFTELQKFPLRIIDRL